jgi:hypothetical protein
MKSTWLQLDLNIVKAEEGSTDRKLALVDRFFDAEKKLRSFAFLIRLKPRQFAGAANSLYEPSLQRYGGLDVESDRPHLLVSAHHHSTEFRAVGDTALEPPGPDRAAI